ncbi:hypothetical protein MELB17_10748 [Marinobacter sp. ELB17]|nr:hypothetical protein MELB17_10748 [Marinobacter sp. ELB17]
MGNTSTIELLSGSQFKVSTELGIDLYSVEFYQKQLLSLIKAWDKFKNNKMALTINE